MEKTLVRTLHPFANPFGSPCMFHTAYFQGSLTHKLMPLGFGNYCCNSSHVSIWIIHDFHPHQRVYHSFLCGWQMPNLTRYVNVRYIFALVHTTWYMKYAHGSQFARQNNSMCYLSGLSLLYCCTGQKRDLDAMPPSLNDNLHPSMKDFFAAALMQLVMNRSWSLG